MPMHVINLVTDLWTLQLDEFTTINSASEVKKGLHGNTSAVCLEKVRKRSPPA